MWSEKVQLLVERCPMLKIDLGSVPSLLSKRLMKGEVVLSAVGFYPITGQNLFAVYLFPFSGEGFHVRDDVVRKGKIIWRKGETPVLSVSRDENHGSCVIDLVTMQVVTLNNGAAEAVCPVCKATSSWLRHGWQKVEDEDYDCQNYQTENLDEYLYCQRCSSSIDPALIRRKAVERIF